MRQTKYIVMITNQRSTKIVNFMTPWSRDSYSQAWSYKSYSENAFPLKKSFSLLSGIDETNKVYSYNDQGSVYQNCKFYNPWVGVLVIGRGHTVYAIRQSKYMDKVMITTEGSATAGTWQWWKCNISSPFLVYTGARIRQIKYMYIVLMTKEG